MPRYIDAEHFSERFDMMCDAGGVLAPVTEAVREMVKELINKEPTADAAEYWYKEYRKLYFELARLRDRIEQAKFFNQREWREFWQDKPKEVQDCDIESADKFYDALLKIIDDMPAADVEPVWYGRWIIDPGCGEYGRCSECEGKSGTQWDGVEPIPLLTAYCPHCGVKMDGDNNG